MGEPRSEPVKWKTSGSIVGLRVLRTVNRTGHKAAAAV